MTQRIGNVVVIESEPDRRCTLCGKLDECRPAGPNGEVVCYDCAMKDPAAVDRYTDGLLGPGKPATGRWAMANLPVLEGSLPAGTKIIVGWPWGPQAPSNCIPEWCGLCNVKIALAPSSAGVMKANPGMFRLCWTCFQEMQTVSSGSA
jgi:hypothetical protein